MQANDVREAMENAKDAMAVGRVFGEPIEKDGITVIPVAKIQGGAGGGSGENPKGEGTGTGSGFGVNAKPAGVYVIKGEDAVWRPAIDVNRVIVGGQIIALGTLLLIRAVIRSRRAIAPAT
jgi:uncharacterized spore protein YtfJ